MEDAEVAAAFADYDAARKPQSSSWRELLAEEAFMRAIERSVRAAALRAATSMPTSAEPCSPTCSTRWYAPRFYATAPSVADDDVLDYGSDPLTHDRLHACVPSLCSLAPAAHLSERTADIRALRHVLTEPQSTCGGVTYCETHGRAHVCVPSRCRHALRSTRGFLVCPLSGRTLASERLQMAYGDGTTIVSGEIAKQRDDEEAHRRSTEALRRSSSSAIEALLANGNSQLRSSTALGRPKKRKNADVVNVREEEAYIDADIPAIDVFPDDGDDNTFGDGAASELARLYAEAYASVHLLLMSDERAAIEQRNRELVVAEARRRINSYITYQRKSGAPVLLSVCRQIERRAMNSRRVYPELVLPPHAIARLTAYYALVAVEMHWQLAYCASLLLERSPTVASKRAYERYTTLSFASIVPNVLDILRTGLRSGSSPIALEEPTLSIFPESQTIEELGIPQKSCTESKKTMKKIIVDATQASLPMHMLRVTQLDSTLVIFGRESVVSTFLRERQRRLEAASASGGDT